MWKYNSSERYLGPGALNPILDIMFNPNQDTEYRFQFLKDTEYRFLSFSRKQDTGFIPIQDEYMFQSNSGIQDTGFNPTLGSGYRIQVLILLYDTE